MVTNTENKEDALRKKTRDFYQNSQSFREKHNDCPVRSIMAAATDKWSILVIFNLSYHKVLRFNRFKYFIPDISSRMLSVTLKRLEEKQIIRRKMYAEVPPRVEYRLTELGKGLAVRLLDVSEWLTGQYE